MTTSLPNFVGDVLDKNYDVITKNYDVILRRSTVANFTDIMKVAIIYLKTQKG